MTGRAAESPVIHAAVLTYERPESLAHLLRSLRDQAMPGALVVDVTVLDNGSERPTADQNRVVCETYEARLITSPTNVYMAGKRLLEDLIFDDPGTPDVLLHLDDDVMLRPDWLRVVSEVVLTRGAACGSVEHWRDELVYSGQRVINLAPEPLPHGVTVQTWNWEWQPVLPRDEPVAVEFAGHRAIAVPGMTAAEVRHDPYYRIGGEDLDYSLMLRSAGCELVASRNAMIDHRANHETEVPGFRTPDNVLMSWRHFYRKWGFLRRNACTEAGMEFADFAMSIIDSTYEG